MNRDRKQLMVYGSRGEAMKDVTVSGNGNYISVEGLTLRDLFAINASEEDIMDVKNMWESNGDYISREYAKYFYADSMLEARDQTDQD